MVNSAAARPAGPDAIEFVRFCYRRRHVGWPELYDEMCAVAGRGLYHGFAADDLGRIGIGFALDQMPALATIVHRVVDEDHERQRLTASAVRATYAATTAAPAPEEPSGEPINPLPSNEREPVETGSVDVAPRLVA